MEKSVCQKACKCLLLQLLRDWAVMVKTDVLENPQSIYRIPPAKNSRYLLFRRGQARYCLRSGDVEGVITYNGILSELGFPGMGRGGRNLHELALPVIDVAYVMGAVAEIATEGSLFVRIKSEPTNTYVAFDEIVLMSAEGQEETSESYDELIGGLVTIEGESVPLMDVRGVSFWAQNKDLHQGANLETVLDDLDEAMSLAGDELVEKIGLNFEAAQKKIKPFDVCIIGGLGHVGLPLGLSLAEAGKRVSLYDVNNDAVKKVSRGEMPFLESGAESALQRVLQQGKLHVTSNQDVICQSYFVVIVIGTPVDEHLNPKFSTFKRFIDEIIELIHDDQHLILRSTVYPGTTEKVKRYLESLGKKTKVSFCPERIAQGMAMEELHRLPQIVASFDETSLAEVKELFLSLTTEVIELSPTEAELGKLFANVWRYVQFAISNQFYEIAVSQGMDYYRIHEALTRNYPRLQGMCKAGFSAGPCLFKDTMQLAAFSNNNFFLGHSAMLINEGLPNFLIQMLKDKYPLTELSVGVLGMAFKADNDDKRSSLSYKLKKMLEIEAKEVHCSDVYIEEEGFVSAEELISRSDIVILATPHKEYKGLVIDGQKILVDIWNFYGKGGLF
jgi:UDP-N-acetyl-D-mannosaminuronic acid dehydrogenase